MIFYLTSQRKFYLKFIIVGTINTLFSYISGLVVYPLLERYFHITLISVIISIINITFSFVTQKLFIFRNSGNIFIEYFKCYITNFIFIIFSTILLTIFVKILSIPFYISYTIQTTLGVLLIYFMHTRFTFKGYKKN